MLLLYSYCVGIVSSRQIERACYKDLAIRVLTDNQQPDHSRTSEFRCRNLDDLKDPASFIDAEQPMLSQEPPIATHNSKENRPQPVWRCCSQT